MNKKIIIYLSTTLIAVLFASGCAQMPVNQTARSLADGEWKGSMGLGYSMTNTGTKSPSGTVVAHGMARTGVGNNLEIDFGATSALMGFVGGKYQFFDQGPFAGAVQAKLGLQPTSSNLLNLQGQVPLIASYDLSDSLSFYGGPQWYFFKNSTNENGVAKASFSSHPGLFVGAKVGAQRGVLFEFDYLFGEMAGGMGREALLLSGGMFF
jgi:hypothetical protein